MELLKSDIFDTLKDKFDAIDVFDNFEETKLKPYIAPPRVEVKLTDEIRALLRAQLMTELAVLKKELKPKLETKIIEKTINNPTKVIVKELIDNSATIIKEAENKIKKALDEYEKSGRGMYPVVVPNSIADQTGNGGKVLSTDGRNTKWITGGGGGNVSTDVYTPTNVTITRSFDATLTSLDEISSVLGSLIKSLQSAGIVQ